jgi:hypothetical protein
MEADHETAAAEVQQDQSDQGIQTYFITKFPGGTGEGSCQDRYDSVCGLAVYEGEAGDTVLSVGYAAFSCRAGDRNYRDRSGHPDLLHLYDHCFR